MSKEEIIARIKNLGYWMEGKLEAPLHFYLCRYPAGRQAGHDSCNDSYRRTGRR